MSIPTNRNQGLGRESEIIA